jgi:hypothetical protein
VFTAVLPGCLAESGAAAPGPAAPPVPQPRATR